MEQVHAEANVTVLVNSSTKSWNTSVRFPHCRIFSTDNSSASETDAEVPFITSGISERHRQVYILISFPAMSLFGLDSLGCLYRYITARPMPLCFSVSWLTLGSCREKEESEYSNKLCLNINGVTELSRNTFHLNQLGKLKCFCCPSENCVKNQTPKSRNLP